MTRSSYHMIVLPQRRHRSRLLSNSGGAIAYRGDGRNMMRAMAPTAATSDCHGDGRMVPYCNIFLVRSGRHEWRVRAPPRAPQFFCREEIAPKMERVPTANRGQKLRRSEMQGPRHTSACVLVSHTSLLCVADVGILNMVGCDGYSTESKACVL